MDLWPVTLEARHSLLSTFGDLDDQQWEVPSLCHGWTIRQVLAHLILAVRPPRRRYITAVVIARGSFDKANHSFAVAEAQRPVDELLADYRSVIDHRFSPAGWPEAAPLSDIMLHSLDLRIPLDLDTDAPAEHYEPVLSLLFSRVGRSFTRRDRPTVRWAANDKAWSTGNGPEVRGNMADLALAAAGRSARLDRLDGPVARVPLVPVGGTR